MKKFKIKCQTCHFVRNLWFFAPPIIKILATPMLTFMCAVVLLGLFIQKTTLTANKMLNENHLIAYTYCSGLPGYLPYLPPPTLFAAIEWKSIFGGSIETRGRTMTWQNPQPTIMRLWVDFCFRIRLLTNHAGQKSKKKTREVRVQVKRDASRRIARVVTKSQLID